MDNKIEFFGILTLILIVLKLLRVISWSWALVLLPAWGPLLFVIIMFVIQIVVGIFTMSL